MNKIEAHMKSLDIDDLHDAILEALYRAAAWDSKETRDAAYHTGAAALKELHERAAKTNG